VNPTITRPVVETWADVPCRHLEWDSAFFGLRIATVQVKTLRPALVARVLEWCESQRVDCLYFLADPADDESLRLAEGHGFHCVDVRVTLETRAVAPMPRSDSGGAAVRPWTPADLKALKAMARTGFRVSRFYSDSAFPRDKADALYEVWIEKSCHGYADEVLVAVDGDRAIGYVTCHLDEGGRGRIGLLGAEEQQRGRGIGTALMNAALEWFRQAGATHAVVVTQGKNRSALRLYGRHGFLIDSIELWYHRWFDTRSGHASENRSV
jgi:dTDP-4-amino-4,6-dideoxy-D-galactose acyltransferase